MPTGRRRLSLAYQKAWIGQGWDAKFAILAPHPSGMPRGRALRALLPAPPDRDLVPNQGCTRDPVIPKRALPDNVYGLRNSKGLPETNGRIRVDRRLVFTIAERAGRTPEDYWAAAQLHTAAAVWGAKPGRNTHRAFKPMANRQAPQRQSHCHPEGQPKIQSVAGG